jgi:hypothetical protein
MKTKLGDFSRQLRRKAKSKLAWYGIRYCKDISAEELTKLIERMKLKGYCATLREMTIKKLKKFGDKRK